MDQSSPLILTRAQVRELDCRAIEELGIPGIVLMENAGRGAAEIILRECGDLSRGVAIVCGGGNNGGDGFVIARHLVNTGVPVTVFLVCDPARLTGDVLIAYRIVERMKISCLPFRTQEEIERSRATLCSVAVIVDAVLGTGFTGQVRSPVNSVIREMNSARESVVSIVAVDLPSGLDCDTGSASEATVRADITITFVAAKTGFLVDGAKPYLGKVFISDIGAPIGPLIPSAHPR
jgi:NAD(P)H-hydrate epimerase